MSPVLFPEPDPIPPQLPEWIQVLALFVGLALAMTLFRASSLGVL